MSKRCVLCRLRDDPEATPVRGAVLAIGLIKTHSLESHLCGRHDRMMATVYAGSTAVLRELFS